MQVAGCLSLTFQCWLLAGCDHDVAGQATNGLRQPSSICVPCPATPPAPAIWVSSEAVLAARAASHCAAAVLGVLTLLLVLLLMMLALVLMLLVFLLMLLVVGAYVLGCW